MAWISGTNIAGLEQRGLEYVLACTSAIPGSVRVVLKDPKSSVSLVIPRGQRLDTELEAKNVRVGELRCMVCHYLAETKRDAEVREAVLHGPAAATNR